MIIDLVREREENTDVRADMLRCEMGKFVSNCTPYKHGNETEGRDHDRSYGMYFQRTCLHNRFCITHRSLFPRAVSSRISNTTSGSSIIFRMIQVDVVDRRRVCENVLCKVASILLRPRGGVNLRGYRNRTLIESKKKKKKTSEDTGC